MMAIFGGNRAEKRLSINEGVSSLHTNTCQSPRWSTMTVEPGLPTEIHHGQRVSMVILECCVAIH
jgi:hypothetical protein